MSVSTFSSYCEFAENVLILLLDVTTPEVDTYSLEAQLHMMRPYLEENQEQLCHEYPQVFERWNVYVICSALEVTGDDETSSLGWLKERFRREGFLTHGDARLRKLFEIEAKKPRPNIPSLRVLILQYAQTLPIVFETSRNIVQRLVSLGYLRSVDVLELTSVVEKRMREEVEEVENGPTQTQTQSLRNSQAKRMASAAMIMESKKANASQQQPNKNVAAGGDDEDDDEEADEERMSQLRKKLVQQKGQKSPPKVSQSQSQKTDAAKPTGKSSGSTTTTKKKIPYDMFDDDDDEIFQSPLKKLPPGATKKSVPPAPTTAPTTRTETADTSAPPQFPCASAFHTKYSPEPKKVHASKECSYCLLCHLLESLFNGYRHKCKWANHSFPPTVDAVRTRTKHNLLLQAACVGRLTDLTTAGGAKKVPLKVELKV